MKNLESRTRSPGVIWIEVPYYWRVLETICRLPLQGLRDLRLRPWNLWGNRILGLNVFRSIGRGDRVDWSLTPTLAAHIFDEDVSSFFEFVDYNPGSGVFKSELLCSIINGPAMLKYTLNQFLSSLNNDRLTLTEIFEFLRFL